MINDAASHYLPECTGFDAHGNRLPRVKTVKMCRGADKGIAASRVIV